MNAPPCQVLVTGAGGFVGGHVVRLLAALGCYRVRALSRRPPRSSLENAPIEWLVGDLRDPSLSDRAVRGVRHVIHCAGWVRLGFDPSGLSEEVNVLATRRLLEASRSAGVERFVFTSTLHTLARGPRESPANEDTSWNLDAVRSPYSETKRRAETVVREFSSPAMATMALCPGMVVGPDDPGPSSTRVLLAMSRSPIVILPGGGIPLIEAETLAAAHVRALEQGEPGARYAVVGPYLSFREQARMVAEISGNPRRILRIPDPMAPILSSFAGAIDRAGRGRWASISRAVVAGGFLRFHVDGRRADETFGLHHGDMKSAIQRTLRSAFERGQAPWLRGRMEEIADSREQA